MATYKMIANRLFTKKMDENQMVENGKIFDNGECPICYSTPQVNKTHPRCGHVFCYECLKEWSIQSKLRATCPICSVAFSEMAHKKGKEQIRPSSKQYFAQIRHCFLRPFTYMGGQPLLFFCWIVLFITTLDYMHGILSIFITLFIFTGIVCCILELRYVLEYGFRPRNLVSYIAKVNGIGFGVAYLCYHIFLLCYCTYYEHDGISYIYCPTDDRDW